MRTDILASTLYRCDRALRPDGAVSPARIYLVRRRAGDNAVLLVLFLKLGTEWPTEAAAKVLACGAAHDASSCSIRK
jgi:hypothetical protein